MKKTLPFLSILLFGVAGCEVEIDPNAFFPQDYTTSMVQLGECRESTQHSNPFFLFYITATSKDAFNAGMPLPEGTVVLKAQYNDGECTDLNRWTAMKKREAGYDAANFDWEWQNVDNNGEIAEVGKIGYCASCHKPCPNGVCSK